MENKKTIFLTGATGLLGSYLLKIFLEQGHKVYTLARSKDNKKAEQRIKELLSFWDEDISFAKIENLTVLDGDITKEYFGLCKKDQDILINNVEEIFHSAAVTDIDWGMDKIRRVNVEGTRNILELGLEWSKKGKLKKINHISTAYVCGDYQDVFKEDNLDVGQKFDNTYEQSKFESEKLIIEYREKGLLINIFRPSMIAGETNTGKTFQFKHIYQFLDMCRLGIFEKVPLKDASVSIVPVNLVSEAIYLLSSKEKDKNKTYHLFPSRHVLAEELVYFAKMMYNFDVPQIVSLEEFKELKLTPAQRMILRNTLLSVNFKIKLDSNQTLNDLRHLNFNIPDMKKDFFQKLLGFYFNHKEKVLKLNI